jgi:hypothetical protein
MNNSSGLVLEGPPTVLAYFTFYWETGMVLLMEFVMAHLRLLHRMGCLMHECSFDFIYAFVVVLQVVARCGFSS